MSDRRILGRLFAIGLLVLLVGGLIAGSAIATGGDCESADERTLCIDDLSVTDDVLLVGDESEFAVTVSNPGDETVTGAVLLYTAGPDDETDAYQMDKVTLEPGESQTLTQPIDASTPGTHGLRIAIVDASTGAQYDTSEIMTVEVREEPPIELGGPIDRTEIALFALIASLLGIAGLGYREYNR